MNAISGFHNDNLLTLAQELYDSWCRSPTTEDHGNLHLCIDILYQFLESANIDQASRIACKHLLGKCLCSRGVFASCTRDLDDGIEVLHTVLVESHDDFVAAINDLASALYARWDITTEIEDLDTSLRVRHLVASEDDLASMSTLYTTIFLRFAHFPRLLDLDEVITFDQQLLQRYAEESANRFEGLCNLAQALLVKWDYDGDKSHVEDAIALLREALSMSDLVEPIDLAIALNSLSDAIQTRVHITDEDIEECVILDRKALSLSPTGHTERPASLASLATTVLVRFVVQGQRQDWDDLMELRRELDRSIGILDVKDVTFQNSAWAYFQRIGLNNRRAGRTTIFRQAYYLRLAEQEIASATQKSTYGAHIFLRRYRDPYNLEETALLRHRMEMSALDADQIRERYLHIGSIACACRGCPLDIAVRPRTIQNGMSLPIFHRWLRELPLDDPWRFAIHHNVGFDFVNRYRRMKDDVRSLAMESLNSAIEHYLEAVKMQNASGRHMVYTTMELLTLTYARLAEEENDRSMMDRSVEYARLTLASTPPGYPRDFVVGTEPLVMRSKMWHQPGDLEAAITLFREAIHDPVQEPLKRFHFADRWVDVAEEFKHDSLLDAYTARLDLLSSYTKDSFNMSSIGIRIRVLGGFDFLSSATEFCLARGLLDKAMNFLIRGRGMMWAQLFQLQRIPFKMLAKAAPNATAKLQLMLQAAEMERAIKPLAYGGPDHWLNMYDAPVIPRLHITRREARLKAGLHRLTSEAYSLANVPDPTSASVSFLDVIPGESFPVVVLNAGTSRCDALILRGPLEEVQLISLQRCNRATLDGLGTKIRGLLLESGRVSRTTRHFSMKKPDTPIGKTDPLGEVLAAIWTLIVQPIITALGLRPDGLLPRLWWYPTGPFWQLPLHAAGIYNGLDQVSVQDYVVSSYLPAFNVDSGAYIPSRHPHILAVHQTNTRGYASLPQASAEIEEIRNVAQANGQNTFVAFAEQAATVHLVTQALPSADIVHFALHGEQDTENPTESGLLLADGRLRVSQLIEMNIPKAGLVFLSACETATGDKDLPEEVIHIAAAMLFVGFRGAIGTMWRINDDDGPPITRETYAYLLEKETFDPRDAARALHLAVRKLRKNVPLIRWVPFIHLGV